MDFTSEIQDSQLTSKKHKNVESKSIPIATSIVSDVERTNCKTGDTSGGQQNSNTHSDNSTEASATTTTEATSPRKNSWHGGGGKRKKFRKRDLGDRVKRNRNDHRKTERPIPPDLSDMRLPRHKYCLAIGYLGTNFYGMARQSDENGVVVHRTVESELENAMRRCGAIPESDACTLGRLQFSRVARTDKGVHAACNVAALRLSIYNDCDQLNPLNLMTPLRSKTEGCHFHNPLLDGKDALLAPTGDVVHSNYDKEKYVSERSDSEKLDNEKLDSGNSQLSKDCNYQDMSNDAIDPINCCDNSHEESDQKAGNHTTVTNEIHSRFLASLNLELPNDIVVFSVYRVGGKFDCRLQCGRRRYQYLLPSCMLLHPITIDDPTLLHTTDVENLIRCRVTEDDLVRLRSITNKYLGAHYFHNFTLGVPLGEASSQRYIEHFDVSRCVSPTGEDGVLFDIKGQSFMLHQIRKMIGLVVEVFRGIVPLHAIAECLDRGLKRQVSRAPGAGLLLDRAYYDGYDRRVEKDMSNNSDVVHPKLDFVDISNDVASYKHDVILPEIWRSYKGCIATTASDNDVIDDIWRIWLSDLSKTDVVQYKAMLD